MTSGRALFGTAVAIGFTLLCAGCIRDTRAQRDDDGAMPFDGKVPHVTAPNADRCAAHKQSGARSRCEDAKYLGQNYVRGLGVGDEVCLEGGFGESAGGACLARGAVVDVASNQVLVEIREAQPSSRWYRNVMGQVWYEEGALVDLYLAERGY